MPSSEPELIWLYYFRCAVTMLFHEQQHHTCFRTVDSCCYWLVIPATFTSSAVATSTSRPGPPSAVFCLFAVLQNGLVFLSKLRGKTVLCRSEDKSFPLVTHCPTNALTPTSWKHNRRLTGGSSPGQNQWILTTVKISSSDPSVIPLSGFICVSGAACCLIMNDLVRDRGLSDLCNGDCAGLTVLSYILQW